MGTPLRFIGEWPIIVVFYHNCKVQIAFIHLLKPCPDYNTLFMERVNECRQQYITFYFDGAWSIILAVRHRPVFFLIFSPIRRSQMCTHFPFPKYNSYSNLSYVDNIRDTLMLMLIPPFWCQVKNFGCYEKYFLEDFFFKYHYWFKRRVLKVRMA